MAIREETLYREAVANTERLVPSRRLYPILLILALATALRLYQIGEESIWEDEGFSLRDAKWPPVGFNKLRFLYYGLLHLWMLFGTSDAWLRGLGVVFGIGSVYAIYALGSRLAGRQTGLVAAFLLAVSPLEINHSQEIRMYALATCLGLVGAIALMDYLESPTRRGLLRWAAWRLLMLSSSLFSILLALADGALLAEAFRKRFPAVYRYRWLILFVVAFCVPAAAYALKKASIGSNAWQVATPRPGLWAALYKLTSFTAYWPIPLHRVDPIFPSVGVMWFYRLYTLALAGVLAVGLREARNPRVRRCATWALLPLASLFVFSNVAVPLWLDRYVLVAAPYMLLLLAVGFLRLWERRRALALLAGAVYLTAVGGALYRYYTVVDRQDYRSAGRVLTQRAQLGDQIAGMGSSEVLRHYFPTTAPILSFRLPTQFDAQGRERMLARADVEQAFAELPVAGNRLWLVYARGLWTERTRLVRHVAQEKYHLESQYAFDGIDLFLLTPQEARHTANSP